MQHYGGGRVPSVSGSVWAWLSRIIVMFIVWSGVVFSSRYVKRSSAFLILVPLMAVIMSPPIVIVVPSIWVWLVPACRPALSAGPPSVVCVMSQPYVTSVLMACAIGSIMSTPFAASHG